MIRDVNVLNNFWWRHHRGGGWQPDDVGWRGGRGGGLKWPKYWWRNIWTTPWKSHTSPIFSSLKTLKLVDINKLQTGCFMYNAMANNLPPQFNNYFIKNTQIHTHFTCQSQQIHIYCPRTKVRKHSIKHFGSILWNSLPLVLKTKPSINTFKSAYKNNLLFQYTALSS